MNSRRFASWSPLHTLVAFGALIAVAALLGLLVPPLMHEAQQRARAEQFFNHMNDEAVAELDSHGLSRYLDEVEFEQLNRIFAENGNTSAESFLLNEGTRSGVDASELSYALNQITKVGTGDKSIDGFIDWVVSKQ